MEPMNLIRREILRQAKEQNPAVFDFGPLEDDQQVADAYEKLIAADAHWDYESEFRSGEVKTGLPSHGNRHYEAEEVAMRTAEGQWVGWTYFYGGGKHGEPNAIPWMEDAYLLSCKEEEKLVVVRTWEVVEG